MWWEDPIWLAGATGGLTAFGVWQVLALVWNRPAARQMNARLRRVRDEAAPALADRPIVVPIRDVRHSILPIFDRAIHKFSLTPRIAAFLQQAGSKLSVGAYLLMCLLCIALTAYAAYSLRIPIVASIPLLVVASLAPFSLMRVKRRKRLNRLIEQLPDAIRLISSSLRAGLGLEVGLNAVVTELPDPIHGEFKQLVNESLLEFDMNDAFHRFAQRIPIDDYQLFAASACLHREVGGNFAELLDQLEVTIRDRFRLYRELKTMTALSRVESFILGILPIALSAILLVLNPQYLQFFLIDPTGRIMLWTIIALQVIGFGIIQWMSNVRID